jgi:tRNA threonylcarbamoyladenosine biosynthesis protein TsaB
MLLETATAVCSVALARDGEVLAELHSDQPNAHSSRLPLFVEQLFEQCHITPKQLDAVCVSSGPGSYTGLRIGVSSAKGFCYALSIPLLSVPTLQGMAAQYYAQHPDYGGMVCPMIDARRMECYTAVYASPTELIKPTSADIIESGIYDEYLNRGEVTFVGDGAEKTRELLGVHPNARYASDFRISAAGMLPIAMQRLQAGQVEDVAYFEPFYLKDFVAKKSIVRGLK